MGSSVNRRKSRQRKREQLAYSLARRALECEGKIRYESLRQTRYVLRTIRALGDYGQHPYQCPWCWYWHVGHFRTARIDYVKPEPRVSLNALLDDDLQSAC